MAGRVRVASHGASLRTLDRQQVADARCSARLPRHGEVLRKFSTRKPVEFESDMATEEADNGMWARRADQLRSA